MNHISFHSKINHELGLSLIIIDLSAINAGSSSIIDDVSLINGG